MTRQMKNSGYVWKEAREIIVSGGVGLKRKEERRKKEGKGFHRKAATTLAGRVKKKLLQKTRWYKGRKRTDDTEEKIEKTSFRRKEETRKKKPSAEEVKIKSVMFVPQTRGGRLAKMLRDKEEELAKISGYRIKIVERGGEKIADILCKSNPWSGTDCEREGCLMCTTKVETGKNKNQSCSNRNALYETWCETCELREKEKADQKQGKKNRVTRMVKYVGETARSCHERGGEHIDDMKQYRTSSHLLKHCLTFHEHEDFQEVKFRMKAVRFHRTAFERQIHESVRIQQERERHELMNSKSEYNRCALPRLGLQLGEKEFKERREQERQDEEREQEMEQRIRELKKKHQNKTRAGRPKGQPKRKKQRISSEGDAAEVAQPVMEKSEAEKRKMTGAESLPPRKKQRQVKLSDFMTKRFIEEATQHHNQVNSDRNTDSEVIELNDKPSPSHSEDRPLIEVPEPPKVDSVSNSALIELTVTPSQTDDITLKEAAEQPNISRVSDREIIELADKSTSNQTENRRAIEVAKSPGDELSDRETIKLADIPSSSQTEDMPLIEVTDPPNDVKSDRGLIEVADVPKHGVKDRKIKAAKLTKVMDRAVIEVADTPTGCVADPPTQPKGIRLYPTPGNSPKRKPRIQTPRNLSQGKVGKGGTAGNNGRRYISQNLGQKIMKNLNFNSVKQFFEVQPKRGSLGAECGKTGSSTCAESATKTTMAIQPTNETENLIGRGDPKKPDMEKLDQPGSRKHELERSRSGDAGHADLVASRL